MYDSYKSNAEIRLKTFNITLEQLTDLILKDCGYCGRPPSSVVTNGRTKEARDNCKNKLLYNGIDRKNDSLGYDINNVITCCKICNFAKRSLSEQEWENWLKAIIKFNYPERKLQT